MPDSDQECCQTCKVLPSWSTVISASAWNDEQLKIRVQSDVSRLLGTSTDVALILDQSGIPKQGKMSVGVGGQYGGCLGKVDNCQVGVYLRYANAHHSSLVDFRLYLPQSWTSDEHSRCKCGVPQEVVFQTKVQLGLQMIRAFVKGGLLFGWVSMESAIWLIFRVTHTSFSSALKSKSPKKRESRTIAHQTTAC